jgi:flagellar basal body-associated protein FliL
VQAVANETEKPIEGAEPGGESKYRGKLKSLLIIGGTVLTQALIVLVVAMVVKGVGAGNPGPQTASAEQNVGDEQKMVILSVTPSDPDGKITAVNGQDGDLKYWSLTVCVRVPEQGAEALKARLLENEPLIRQEIQTVIRGSDAAILKREADHATLKRQIRNALNRILGKGAIEEVVIPECLPSGMDG